MFKFTKPIYLSICCKVQNMQHHNRFFYPIIFTSNRIKKQLDSKEGRKMLNLLILLIGVLFLLIMIVKFKINTFVSLIVVSVLLGLGLRMPIAQIPISIMDGIGGSLNELVVVFGFGAVLGRLVSDAGGAYRISKTLVNFFGKKHIQWAIVI